MARRVLQPEPKTKGPAECAAASTTTGHSAALNAPKRLLRTAGLRSASTGDEARLGLRGAGGGIQSLRMGCSSADEHGIGG